MAYVVELTAPRAVQMREYPTPEPSARQIRVRTLYSGISAGTELAMYRGTNPYLEKQWDAEAALFLPGQSTFDYPVDGATPRSGRSMRSAMGHRTRGRRGGGKLVPPLSRGAAGWEPAHVLPPGLDPMVGTFDRVGAVALNACWPPMPASARP